MKKTIFIATAAFILLTIALLLAKPEYKWLLLNGYSAEKYAYELLAGHNPVTPEWAIDLVVIKENELVQFNEHNSTIIYVYSPNKTPSIEGVSWSHIWGAWYAGKIKT